MENELNADMKITRTLSVKLPRMPNFIRATEGVPPDGLRETTMDIGELTEEDAKTFTEIWSNGFMVHWRQRREQRI